MKFSRSPWKKQMSGGAMALAFCCVSWMALSSGHAQTLAPRLPEELPMPQAENTGGSSEATAPEATVPTDVPPTPTREDDAQDSTNETQATESANDENAYEVLTQGPVHEAFGAAVDEVSAQLLVAPLPPPEPIDEVRPKAEQQAPNSQWIEGYWHWSDDLDGFVWVSGMYREIPPGRIWIPGEWVESEGKYVRYPGYWGIEGAGQNAFLPAPPEPIQEVVPAAPNDQSFWLPGQWIYGDGDYQWQAGYWTRQYADWVWQPACYVNTPGGYVFVSGYWDYEPLVRGTLYAPIYFPHRHYPLAGFRYLPRHPIAQSASLMLHLFVRPGYRTYYYGDYYRNQYVNTGYLPWYLAYRHHYATSTLIDYYQWKYARAGISFSTSMRQYNDYLLNTAAARPARTSLSVTALSTPSAIFPVSSFGVSFDAMVRNAVGGVSATQVQLGGASVAAGSAARIGSSATVGGSLLGPRSILENAGPSGIVPRSGNSTLDAARARLDPRSGNSLQPLNGQTGLSARNGSSSIMSGSGGLPLGGSSSNRNRIGPGSMSPLSGAMSSSSASASASARARSNGSRLGASSNSSASAAQRMQSRMGMPGGMLTPPVSPFSAGPRGIGGPPGMGGPPGLGGPPGMGGPPTPPFGGGFPGRIGSGGTSRASSGSSSSSSSRSFGGLRGRRGR